MVILYIYYHFGKMHKEKSGNPAFSARSVTKNSLTYVCDEKRLNDLNVEKDTFLSIELATHNA
jgi:hypothetical protein